MAEYIVKDRETGEILCQGSPMDCSAVIGCDYSYVRSLAINEYKYNSKYGKYKVERIGKSTGKPGGGHRKDVICCDCGVLMENVSAHMKRCAECARKRKNAYYREKRTRQHEDGLVVNRCIKSMNHDGCEGCIYFYGGQEINRCCNYLLDTGKRRPCPPGTECTVKKERKRYREEKE